MSEKAAISEREYGYKCFQCGSILEQGKDEFWSGSLFLKTAPKLTFPPERMRFAVCTKCVGEKE